MSSKYARLSRRIWKDTKFMELDVFERHVFQFLFSNTKINAIGVLEGFTPAGIARLMKLTKDYEERFPAAFAKLQSVGMIKFDEGELITWVPNYLKYNMPETPAELAEEFADAVDDIVECPLRNEIIERTRELVELHAVDEKNPTAWLEALPAVFGKARNLKPAAAGAEARPSLAPQAGHKEGKK